MRQYDRHYDDLEPDEQARCAELAGLLILEAEERWEWLNSLAKALYAG